jgi:hypothetical protein
MAKTGFGPGASKASQRLARAVELGFDSWRRRRDKSADKRRDGGLKDALKNGAFAIGTTIKEASWASSDFFHGLGRKRDPRRLLLRALLPK